MQKRDPRVRAIQGLGGCVVSWSTYSLTDSGSGTVERQSPAILLRLQRSLRSEKLGCGAENPLAFGQVIFTSPSADTILTVVAEGAHSGPESTSLSLPEAILAPGQDGQCSQGNVAFNTGPFHGADAQHIHHVADDTLRDDYTAQRFRQTGAAIRRRPASHGRTLSRLISQEQPGDRLCP